MKSLPGHPIDDPMHPVWHESGFRNMPDEKALRGHVASMEKHFELHPDIRYQFCGHSAYAGANRVLADLFCRFCKEDLDAAH
jgi:hypothetical protein